MTHLNTYLQLARQSEQSLADSLRTVANGHAQQPDIYHTCLTLATMSDHHVADLGAVADALGPATQEVELPERLHHPALSDTRQGQVGLLRDLQDLVVLATLVQTTWTALAQAAQGARNPDLLQLATSANTDTARQISWLNTRLKAAAPQALLIAP